MSKKQGKELLYTGEELDGILFNYARPLDWVQLRKGCAPKDFTRAKIYRLRDIEKVFGDNSKIYAKLDDNKGKERRVSLSKLKYITEKQRDSVIARENRIEEVA